MAGYSGKPIWEKLGIKEDMSILVRSNTKYEIIDYIKDYPGKIKKAKESENEIDLIHIFVDSFEILKAEIDKAKRKIKKNGMIWISWPKKSSKLESDISEDRIREVILPLGLVDVKVCSITDEIWSGLKIVWRKENRD